MGEVAVERAGVLAGQHLGRGHQRRLVLVGDGDEQGVDRDGGLARADVGLEEPLHRPVAGQVAADLGDGPVLVAGQREGEQPADARVDGRRDGQRRGRRLVARLAPAQGQGDLQDEQLLVDEPLAGQAAPLERLRRVDLRAAPGPTSGQPCCSRSASGSISTDGGGVVARGACR